MLKRPAPLIAVLLVAALAGVFVTAAMQRRDARREAVSERLAVPKGDSAPAAPAPPITRLAPGAPDADADWAQSLQSADEARASFARDHALRRPGTRFSESGAGLAIAYACSYEAVTVTAIADKARYKAVVETTLDSWLTRGTETTHAQDRGAFVYYPSPGNAGVWACDPKASTGKAVLGEMPGMALGLPCMNIAVQCLGRHASQDEFNAALGK